MERRESWDRWSATLRPAHWSWFICQHLPSLCRIHTGISQTAIQKFLSFIIKFSRYFRPLSRYLQNQYTLWQSVELSDHLNPLWHPQTFHLPFSNCKTQVLFSQRQMTHSLSRWCSSSSTPPFSLNLVSLTIICQFDEPSQSGVLTLSQIIWVTRSHCLNFVLFNMSCYFFQTFWTEN